MFMFIRLVIIVALYSSTFNYCETLFYKKDGTPISPEEHEILYKIMLETQFPMNMVFGKYVGDEIKVMNERIKSKLPKAGIEAIFIPTTLYEIFVLNSLYESREAKNLVKETGGFLSRNDKIFCPDEIEIAEFKNANLNPNLIRWHLNINNHIINKLKSNSIVLPLSLDKSLRALSGIKGLIVAGPGDHKVIPSEIERPIQIDYKAHDSNQFVLYRGTNRIDDDIHPKDESKNRSISFGSSLFAGILCDASASAYFYINKEVGMDTNYGYAVFIDKQLYADGVLNNMFVIPPLITLLGLTGRGEFFHSRTKVLNLCQQKNDCGFAKGETTRRSLIPHYQIKATTPKVAEEIQEQIFKYIENNHQVFKKK